MLWPLDATDSLGHGMPWLLYRILDSIFLDAMGLGSLGLLDPKMNGQLNTHTHTNTNSVYIIRHYIM